MSLLTGLTAYWKLDESSGDAADSHGSNTLTNESSVVYTTGLLNNGAQNNGTSGRRLRNTNFTGLTSSSTNTWSFWFKRDPSSAGYLIDHLPSANGVRLIVYDSTSTIRMFANGNEVASSTITNGVWYHVVVTKNGTSWELFLNNTSQGTTTSGGLSYSNLADFALLESADGSGGAPCRATIDEVGVWSRVLDSTERTQLYGSGTPPAYPFTTGSRGGILMYF